MWGPIVDFGRCKVYLYTYEVQYTPCHMIYTGWSKKTDTQIYFGITSVIQHRF